MDRENPRTSFIDFLIAGCLTVSLTAFAGVGWLYSKKIQTKISRSGVEVGFLSQTQGDIRIRDPHNLAWEQGLQGERLLNATAIFAGVKASALFQFDQGAEISVDEGSLVIVRVDDADLHLEYGTVVGFLKKNQKLKIRFGSRSAVLKGQSASKITIRKTGDQIELVSAESPVTLAIDDRELQVGTTPVQISISEEVNLASNLEELVMDDPIGKFEKEETPRIDLVTEVIPSTAKNPKKRFEQLRVRRTIPKMIASQSESNSVLPKVYKPAPPALSHSTFDVPLLQNSSSYPKVSFSFGVGGNYVDFSQQGSATKNLQFATVKGPSYSVHGGIEFENGLGFESMGSSHPGQVKSSQVNVSGGDFAWETMSLETVYRKNRAVFNGRDEKLGWRAGLQRHRLPYVQTASFTQTTVRTQQIYSLAGGVDYSRRLAELYRLEFLMRYQLPIAQSSPEEDRYRSSSKFAFDGSLGMTMQASKAWQFGLFWYGQWLESEYSIYNPVAGTDDSGRSRYFFTNMEVRLGYSF